MEQHQQKVRTSVVWWKCVLYNKERDFDLYCISTAFEQSKMRKKRLQGQLVGASYKALGSPTRNIPVVPVAHDVVVCKPDASEELIVIALESTKHNARKQGVPHNKLEEALSKVGIEVLPEKID